MNITEFLEARIAEDEAECQPMAALEDDDRGGWAIAYAERVLAECAAKRAVLVLHQPTVETVEWFDDATGTGKASVCPQCRPKDPTDWNPPIGMAGIRPEGFVPSYTLAPCPTLCALAAVYADHPDYQQEWHVGESDGK